MRAKRENIFVDWLVGGCDFLVIMWQQLHLEDLKVNSTISHVSFLQDRVTHIHELIYDNEILLDENISELKKN